MSEGEKILIQQKNTVKKKLLFGIIVILMLIISSVIAIAMGTIKIPVLNVIKILINANSGRLYNIIWNIRLPRILTAVTVGIGLSVAGATMQSVLRNPLGSPFTLGISHAAAFGAAFSILILGSGSLQSSGADAVIINNPYITTLSAFIWSFISTLLILLLAGFKNSSSETLILAGVAMGSLFTAGTTALQYFASDVEIASIIFWTFGDVGKTTWKELGFIFIVVVMALIYFITNCWNYNVLDSGDETAKSLGINVDRLRITSMFVASLVTSILVSFVGIIGFVGLVVPHIVRKIIGGNKIYLLPFSGITGGLLLLLSDLGARTILSPVVLPVGIITSFMGAPLFIYLIIRGRQYW